MSSSSELSPDNLPTSGESQDEASSSVKTQNKKSSSGKAASQDNTTQERPPSVHSESSNRSKSNHSRVSSRSNISSVIELKRAEAQSARVELQFAQKEAELSLKKAQMDSELSVKRAQLDSELFIKKAQMDNELKILESQKKIAVAEAEVQVLESVDRQSEQRSPPPLLLPYDDPVQKVTRYISDNIQTGDHSVEIVNQEQVQQIAQMKPNTLLNPEAPPYIPDCNSDFMRYLLRKDLVLSRLTNFNNKPEDYPIWKSGFKSVISELKCSPNEEFDLLLKWLGTESRKQTLNIRKANLHDPAAGLQLAWRRLEERYASPERIEAAIKTRLNAFPTLTMRECSQLFELSDLVCEIEAMMSDPTYSHLFAYFNSSLGVNQIVDKLPFPLQEKWLNHAFGYKERHHVSFPPFSVFSKFLSDLSRLRNDPSFNFSRTPQHVNNRSHVNHPSFPRPRTSVQAARTDVQPPNSRDQGSPNPGLTGGSTPHVLCPLHETRHSLNECNAFQTKPYEDKIDFLKSKGICFKCCSSNQHLAKECNEHIQCAKCHSTRHCTAIHCERFIPRKENGGENKHNSDLSSQKKPVSAKCTQVCGNLFEGKSCSKNILVLVYPKGQKHRATKLYATIDDQSNASLCSTFFFHLFDVASNDYPYTISSCGGVQQTTGRRASGFIVESLNEEKTFDLPTLIECDAIPNNKQEIPTPEVAQHHSHLKEIAAFIPPLDEEASIHLLIGRDLPEVHHVLSQLTGPTKSPYAQKLPLGWVIVGESCLGKIHPPQTVNVNKLYTLANGRPSVCQPCPNNLRVKENTCTDDHTDAHEIGSDIFLTTKDDDKQGKSSEDREFIDLMGNEMKRNSKGTWVAPLPFKESRPRLPNNRAQAFHRAKTLRSSLLRDEEKRKHFIDFMSKILNSGHAEIAPALDEQEECWYLPIFGVYHPRKPLQIRAVFDSSATYQGVSLNSVLLQGPDLTNELLGILLRFRREPVAVMADIQQMFHCFEVQENHRNFLRFFWFRDNNPELEQIEYRMKVHVFGNRPSPAVATFGLRKAARAGDATFGKDVADFVERDFYVDDAVASFTDKETAIDLLKRTKDSLATNGNIRLHKIVSNSSNVMRAFPAEDLAKNLKDFDLTTDQLPMQRTLGISWDIEADMFNFSISAAEKPFTRRGVLSAVNSIFDPIGFLAPVVIEGRMILRDLISSGVGWDETLPPEHYDRWKTWKNSLKSLETLHIPRMLVPVSFELSTSKEFHVFTDASEKAVAAAAYVKAKNDETENPDWGFIMGKAKLAPVNGHTIPRLELCGAVLGVDIALGVSRHLGIPLTDIVYHTDSKIVLGYISNNTKRFSIYVTNRVAYVRKYSSPGQWHYISSQKNPADQATRPVAANLMKDSPWLLGPIQDQSEDDQQTPDVVIDKTQEEKTPVQDKPKANTNCLGSYRFEKFSQWKNLVRAVLSLKNFVKSKLTNGNTDDNSDGAGPHELSSTETFIIKIVQGEVFREEMQCLKTKSSIAKNSSIIALSPFIDTHGVLRVGGRLRNSELPCCEKNPAIIPGKHHIALLLVRHHHELSQHQGRHFTEGAVRASGLWIVGGKRLINSVLHKCVRCKMFRGKQESQRMSNLPEDRTRQSPPFSYVGVDTFGPWEVVSRKTRGGLAHSKRWALLFTCLVTRAIHIEVIEEMSSSCFVNALRRFVAIRGNVKQFRSDRGTNFIGATEMLQVDTVNVEDTLIKDFLDGKRIKWIFNPPHSAHMGGAWERLIGVVKRILGNMTKDVSSRKFTHEVLTTFMCEVCAIVNARPITAVSSDPEDPEILSPSTLLTQKTCHEVVPLQGCQGDIKDLYRKQWKQVQLLADTFWSRFRSHYLSTLQTRSKWTEDRPNIQRGDIVLLEERNCSRNEWPKAIVTEAIKSDDGKVRKVVVKTNRDGQPVCLTRPIGELVVLLRAEN